MEKKLTLYKFYADWCNPCKHMSQIIEKNQIKFDEVLSEINCDFKEINTDDDSVRLCDDYNIRSIPAFVLVDENQILWKHAGTIEINDLFNELLKFKSK